MKICYIAEDTISVTHQSTGFCKRDDSEGAKYIFKREKSGSWTCLSDFEKVYFVFCQRLHVITDCYYHSYYMCIGYKISKCCYTPTCNVR